MKNDNRASQIEALLRQLPQTAEQGLSGLTAGPQLKASIQLAAAEKKTPRTRFSPALLTRWASVACAALLILVIGVSGRTPQDDPAAPTHDAGSITSGMLGETTPPSGAITADLGNSGVIISAGSGKVETTNMWAASRGGSFPLIGVNGKYYRLLTTPRNVSSSLLGNTLGTVTEFTSEPSLSGTDTLMSNVAAFGETVYGVRGMEDTLVAASVDGQMRLFQRVSFNGNSRRGSETLSDTLQVEGRVVAMALTNVGAVTDADECDRLMDILFDCATFKSNGSIDVKQTLLLELDNGLVLQLAVSSDRVAACGVWSCPEFLEAFEEACD